VGLLVGLSATFGNALINVNLASLSGALGVYVVQASWLPAIYVAFNASANLMLVKARAQFGIPAVTHGLLIAYAAAALLQFVVPGFATAVAIRAVCGMTAAALMTLTIYNLIQALPARLRPVALVIGVSLPQIATPLARMVPVEMLALDNWQALHLIELGVALGIFAAISALPLPPTERSKAFEPLDFVSFGLILPAMVLLCGVVNEGRLLWWSDTPWLGWALAAAVPLFTAAILIEVKRPRPLLQLRWMTSRDILRFAGVAVVVRLALAEQTYGAIGLLGAAGLTNDQYHALFALVALAMVAGIAVAVLTLSEQRLPYLVMAASLIIALGAGLDSMGNNLVRPPQLYLSQALLGFGTTLFMGPTLVYGLLRVFQRGTDHLISFMVLFSVTQNVGGLVGSALLGSYQTAATHYHAATLAERLTASDPLVAARLQGGAPQLAQAMAREATYLALNDVFRLVAAVAALTALYIAFVRVLNIVRQRELVASGGDR
jgi:MFS family permease